MSIRGTVTLECETKGCHAEHVWRDDDLEDGLTRRSTSGGVKLVLTDGEWLLDDDGHLRCPQCCEENPREKGDDDGREYADPRDYLAGRE